MLARELRVGVGTGGVVLLRLALGTVAASEEDIAGAFLGAAAAGVSFASSVFFFVSEVAIFNVSSFIHNNKTKKS